MVKEFLLFYFKKAINIMFIQEKTNTVNLTGILLECLKESINYIEDLNNKKDKLKNISLLYAISYVKVYLSYYVN